MKLSIVFITYNRSIELIRAIKSCFPIGVDDYEIIVWDNNSEEDEINNSQRYIQGTEANIHYYCSKSNLGVAGGRNAAWRKCKGEYVFFLDDDAVIKDEHYFPKIIQYMDGHKEVAALAAKVYEPEKNNYLIPKQQYKRRDGLIQVLDYIGCAFMVRRSKCNQDYLYPEKLVFGSEEYYSSMLIWNSGFEIHYYTGGTVHHMPSKINRYVGKERDTNFLANTYLIRLLTYPVWMKPVLNIMLVLRTKRHGLSINDCKKLVAERYDSKEVQRIKISTIIRLCYRFGLINII